MTEQLCIHELAPGTCADCGPRRARRTHVPAAISARFPGRCGGCGEDIYVGDALVRDDDDTTWVHEECA